MSFRFFNLQNRGIVVHTSPIRPEVNTSQNKYIPSRSYSCVWLVLIREGHNKQEGSTYVKVGCDISPESSIRSNKQAREECSIVLSVGRDVFHFIKRGNERDFQEGRQRNWICPAPSTLPWRCASLLSFIAHSSTFWKKQYIFFSLLVKII